MNISEQSIKGGLMSFAFETNEVRMIVIDDAPWWVGRDVCEALGYAHPVKDISKLCKGEPKRYPLATPGGIQEVRIINEPDLFRLITHSRLPAAQKFERLVFEEILPSIRRRGYYASPSPIESFPFIEKQIAKRVFTATLRLVKVSGMESPHKLCRYYKAGLTYKEIAKLMDVSERKIHRWLGWGFEATILERRRGYGK